MLKSMVTDIHLSLDLEVVLEVRKSVSALYMTVAELQLKQHLFLKMNSKESLSKQLFSRRQKKKVGNQRTKEMKNKNWCVVMEQKETKMQTRSILASFTVALLKLV